MNKAKPLRDFDEKLSQLHEIEELCGDMLTKARSGDWEGVQEIESLRKEDISQFFKESPPLELQSEVDRVLRILVDTELAMVTLSTVDKQHPRTPAERASRSKSGCNKSK